MKNFFITTTLIALTGLLFSFQTSINENDLLGSWKVTKVERGDSWEKGEKIVTFTSDHKTYSEDTESKRIKSGKWYFNAETNEVIIQSDQAADEKMIIQSISKSKMEILSREKSISLEKIKTRTYDSE
jgi:hypothetical protein